MSSDPKLKLDDLFAQYAAARREGRNVSIHELTKDFPQLAGPLRDRINGNGHVNGAAASGGGGSHAEELDALFDRFVDAYFDGHSVPVEELTKNRPELAEALRAMTDEFLRGRNCIDEILAGGFPTPSTLPQFPGFTTIEALGKGGAGAVYKVQDKTLGAIFALKVIRPDAKIPVSERKFLVEALTQSRAAHPGIARVMRFQDGKPAFILMDFVRGFPLGNFAAALEWRQYAHIMAQVCEAVAHAHKCNVQHRDLKPSNIMVDGKLSPKIIDFGLGDNNPRRGHHIGTLPYMAPESFDDKAPLDERTDVYALGVILYELLTGRVPYPVTTRPETIKLIRRGEPRLPSEYDSRIPHELERIALHAMARNPTHRYPSAQLMAEHLRDYMAGRPVPVNPAIITETLQTRVRAHVEDIRQWFALKLIHEEESRRLQDAYLPLVIPDDDWIAQSRMLTRSLIWLYLGAFLLACGSLFYFYAHRVQGAFSGLAPPLLVLALPFASLNFAGRYLYADNRKAVAVAFLLAAVCLLPLFLLIVFHESQWLMATPETPNQIFASVSNHQLQITILIACLWAGGLAIATGTAALSALSVTLVFLFALAILGDFGLRRWVNDWQFHVLAAHLSPLLLVYLALANAAEGKARERLAPALYVGAALVLVLVLDLAAYDGKAFFFLGIPSLDALESPNHKPSNLIETLAALSLNGAVFYWAASVAARHGTRAMIPAQWLLFAIAPFSTLAPLGHLCRTQDYSQRFNWIYLGASLAFVLLSHARQRRSFYYAGLINTGSALVIIASREKWFNKQAWSVAIVLVGLSALVAGYVLDRRQRQQRGPT